jgi:hypothetical protein
MNRTFSIALTLFFSTLLFGCAGISIKTHSGFIGPDIYEATDGKIPVYYYNGDCCCIAKEVLEVLADRANRQDVDWNLMLNQVVRDSILQRTCDSLKAIQQFPVSPH